MNIEFHLRLWFDGSEFRFMRDDHIWVAYDSLQDLIEDPRPLASLIKGGVFELTRKACKRTELLEEESSEES